jgi:hypothetical protein
VAQRGISRAALAVPIWSRPAPQHVLLQQVAWEGEQDALERIERILGGRTTWPRVPPIDAGRPVLGGVLRHL